MPVKLNESLEEKEGVIKYRLIFSEQPLSIEAELLGELNAARDAMVSEALIGIDNARYGGLGFGNLSVRCAQTQTLEFIISGSQTGRLGTLRQTDLACVTRCDSQRNLLYANGLCQPSSESMTHGTIYQNRAAINAVIHIHSPDIWYHSAALGLPETSAEVAYGTPQMALAVAELMHRYSDQKLPFIFAMRGHQDGVVASGDSLQQCAQALSELVKAARKLN